MPFSWRRSVFCRGSWVLRACSDGVVSTLLGLPSSIMPGACGLRIRSRRCWLARKLFRFSLLYLAGIFAVLLFEALTFKLLAAFGVF